MAQYHVAFNGWFWDQPNTGSGQYLRYLLHNLRRIAPELKMTLVLPPRIRQADGLPPNIDTVTTSGFGGKLGKVWFENRTFPAQVAKLKADIAHVPYWGPPLSSPAKLVVSILDVIPLVIPDYAYGIGARLYTSLVSAAAPGAAHVITLSEAAKADIVKYLNLPEAMITPIHLAVNEAYHPRMGAERDKDVRAKYSLPNDYILCVSGFDVRKQVNQLLLAYTYVLQAEGEAYPLVIGGREPQWGTRMFPDMRKYAEELGISEQIHWIGYFDEADKPSLYRMATISVFPSIYEGFGLPVLEAMASGTPVVANNIPPIAEIAGDGAFLIDTHTDAETGLPIGDARRMAGAMIALLGQKSLRDTMVNQGLAQATKFSWRKTAQQTLQVYDEVMSRK